MCGIAGIVTWGRSVDPAAIDRFTDSLAHRGPDGRGTFCDGPLALGHRRLAILDLSPAGACPMTYAGPDGRRLVVTLNGEIYNFIELRDELRGKGYRFASESDTEVAVAAYHCWGVSCLDRFNGMWAIAIWDPQARVLFLSRDRFGVKPLYYAVEPGRFSFASELKAFLHLDSFSLEANDDAVAATLRSPTTFEGSSDATLLRGVAKLPGGGALSISEAAGLTTWQWWCSADHPVDVPLHYDEQVERFAELFLDAVRLRLRSDVRVGTSLSGGLDSSAVVCAMHRLLRDGRFDDPRVQRDSQSVFVASFPGTLQDETPYAEEVIRATGLSPEYWQPSPEIREDEVLKSVYYGDDIVGTALVPMMGIYQAMRKRGVVVSLDGHGGDELLAGYPKYLHVKARDLKGRLYEDLHARMLPSILRNFDRSSMRHGVEVRCPLLDFRLVTFVLSLGWSSVVGAGYTKRILRDAMVGVVPERVRTRQCKIGFNSTPHVWYNSYLRDLLLEMFDARSFIESRLWDGRELRARYRARTAERLWRDCPEHIKEAGHLWTIVNATLWQRLFVERSLTVPGE
jgi:asparagine synthase (glutamine-hydrolysing)